MQVIRSLCLIMALLGLGLPAHAQVESAKGMASVNYAAKLTPEIKAKAFHDAELNAIERYVAESGASQSESFDVIREKVSASLSDYVLGATLLSEDNRADARQYSVAVHVDLNAARLRNVLKNSSAVANTTDQQKSPLTFVFVARAQNSIKAFDAHTYKRTDDKRTAEGSRDQSRAGTEGESIGAAQVATNSSTSERSQAQASSSSVTESGGSTMRRADEVTWTLVPVGYINTIVTGIFDAAAFEVVEAEYVEPQSNGLLSIQALQSDYKSGNDLQPQTLRNAVQGLQAAQIPYLALATLDVGIPDKDPTTGLIRVYVTVTAKVVQVTGRFPRNVAAAGPEQFAGLGPSADVAQTNALKLAADKAARELVSQINVAGVH